MRLLIHGLNHAPEPTGVGKFTGEMVAWLAARGHRVEVVTAPAYYPGWRVTPGQRGLHWRREMRDGAVVRRCPLYVPANPGGAKRLLHLASFAASSLPVAMAAARSLRPEVVIAVAPTLLAAPGALAAARAARAHPWLHVQDFETEAAFSLGLLGGVGSRRWALSLERRILAGFDRISTISEAMGRRLVDKGVSEDRIRLFPNWVDTGAIRPLDGVNPLRAELGIAEDRLVALYAGTMGEKQGLEVLVSAAELLEHDPRILFVLAGEGAAKARLAVRAGRLGNLRFLPLQPAARLNHLLNLADLHLLPEREGAADLVMPSKLGGMLASGRPVAAAVIPGGQIARAVEGAGLVVPSGDAAALASAVRLLADDPALRATLGAKARSRARADWDREPILARFEGELLALAEA